MAKQPIITNKEIVDIMERYHSDDAIIQKKAAEEMLDKHMAYISSVILRCFPTYKGYWEDLIQCGVIGILIALKTYQPCYTDKNGNEAFIRPTTFFSHM